MSTTARHLGIRLDTDLAARIDRFESLTGVGAATLGRSAVVAALDHFDAHMRIVFPLHIVDDYTHAARLNEQPAAYGAALYMREVAATADDAAKAAQLLSARAAAGLPAPAVSKLSKRTKTQPLAASKGAQGRATKQ